ncbi:MAG: GNAT family N-acetyltransferase [Microgenomates group bacterium]|nr:GNAT family N-acetyltransferase [Microgenomates group bacterium]
MSSVEIYILKENEINNFWPVFAEILSNGFPEYSKKVVDYFLKKIYNRPNFLFWLERKLKSVIVAKFDQQIIGFAIVDEPYGGVSFCRWLGVKTAYQKKGIGTKLIKAWENLAFSQGCHKMEIASRPAAKDFYKKAGLTLEGCRKLSYFGIDQFVFGKIIGQPDDVKMTG